ncbi:hypothetical protein ACPBEI_11580 [Latilactobacillus sakei]
MNLIEIKQEADEAIKRSGWKKSYIADALHTTATNISNWLSPDRNFPLQALSDLANLLGDYRFSCIAAEYTFGILLLPTDHLQDVPQNRYFASIKEENERKALEDGLFMAIMAKSPETWTDKEIDYMKLYSRELEEETLQESSYSAAIKQSLQMANLNRKEFIAYGK